MQVESWFEGGGVPLSGKVRVLRPDGTLLRELPLNARGLCVFRFDRPEDLHLEVRDTGHRARQPGHGKRPLVIKAPELLPSYAAAVSADVAACLASPAPPLTAALLFAPHGEVRPAADADAEPLADHSRHFPFDRIFLGVALLLAVPLGMHLARRLRAARGRH